MCIRDRPDKAVEKTQQALEYYDSRNAIESVISPVVNQLMESQLRAKKYVAAVDFAIDRIGRDPTTLPAMYRKMKDQVDRLKEAADFTGALELITQFKRIDLGKLY